ncbi:MAG: tetratricopeptide repeat protein [Sulfuricurvum sp.]|uniref:tetratricopeptide repeat protein n=1 Tax=Sulfuricurvum sp. TaxID=2025608 RepID=UPI0026118A58|nr:tetratricopeptide repeat protein [Sulfuricurvum sp.]MDD2367787.1 tetratricopeptide repeat protein [Sulfuricurvum sp.]MDD2950980.1 tetratricopeptide repeat protein [Sulfuricurvum sp.]MDD5118224.1 tetratricopeptide repeat protein [Sulfuricurvum sp.]
MRHWIALCLCFPLFALELSIQTGKEEGATFSILHLQNAFPFTCDATNDEFGETRRIDCRIPQATKQTFSPINNAQFSITGVSSPQGYSITILPKAKMKLIPLAFDLSKETETFQGNIRKAKHWSVVGYTQTLPLIVMNPTPESGINFPINIKKDMRPIVGGLDLKGNPIKITRVQDVTDYMEMKKAYEAKRYDRVLDLSTNALKNYPKTVFKNELLLYQIRALHHEENSEKLIEIAKQFLRDYSSDPSVAEVLAYIADAYGKIGQSVDADYFFDRLFDEQADSPFASLGMLYKAEQLEGSGEIKNAVELYKKALETSKDVAVASEAAFKLAQIELNNGNTKKAAQYVDKIASANPNYFKDVRDNSMAMAETFFEKNDPKTAARISESLLNATDKKSPDYEVNLKALGFALAKANNKLEALKRFNEYLDTYKYGQYIEDVRRAKDSLFFDDGDKNTTKEIKKYDELIERYGNDSVGKKALYKKAQLLFKEQKYQAILDMESYLYRLESTEYPETNSMISKSAIGLEKARLKEGKCVEAMAFQKMYKIRLLPEWDEYIFNCELKTTQYAAAKKIAQSHLKSKSIAERQIWLSRMVKTQFGLGEYKEAIKGGEELITLLDVEKNPSLNDIYRTMFDAAQRVSDDEGMIRHIKSVEGAYPNDFKDIERYTQMVSLGLKRKDEGMVQTYGRKVSALQERTKTYTQSPYIEFTLAQSYQNLGKDSAALSVLKTLDKQKLDTEKRARQQYLIGAIEQKLGHKREARDAFNASIKANKNSAWGKLAKDALGLM